MRQQLGKDFTPQRFQDIARRRMPEFLAGIGTAGAPSRRRAAEAVERCATVLDVGCGPAVFYATLRLHARPDVELERYVGVDAVPDMFLGGVKRNLHLEHQHSRCELIDARAEKLPFANGEFEGVVVRHLLEHLEDPMPALREAARVCSRVLVLVFSQWPREGAKSLLCDAHLKALRWSHPAPLLEAELRGSGMGPTTRENFSPANRARLSVREAFWTCSPRAIWVDQVQAAMPDKPA